MSAHPLRTVYRRRRVALSLAAALAALGTAVAVVAYFVTTGAGSGTGSVSTLAAPANVQASQPTSGVGTVHVTWKAVSVNGGNPTGYYVQRFAGSSPSAACASSSTSLLAGGSTSCDDTGVAAGTYTYTVTAVYRSWSATSSPSNSVTVVLDTTPPATTLAFPANGGDYGATAWSSGCTVTGICGSATDSTGVQSVRVSIRQGSGSYWNGSSFASATEVFQTATLASPGATSTAWNYPLARPADGSYTVHVQATDTLGNATPSGTFSSSATFTVDTVAPTAPTAVSLANGAGVGSAYIDIANKSSVSVLVSGISEVSASESITVTISDGTHSVTKTAIAAATNLTVTGINASTLSDGTNNISISAVEVDGAGNTSASRAAATTYSKDTVAPSPTAVTLVNGTGGTAGELDPRKDQVVLTYSEVLNAASICSSWSNGSTQTLSTANVMVNVAYNGGSNLLTVTNSSGCTLNVGTVALGAAYVTADSTFGGTGSGNASSVSWNPTARTLTISVGALNTGTLNTTVQAAATAGYTAASALTDLAANPITTTQVTTATQRF
jgi:hypothetical protein